MTFINIINITNRCPPPAELTIRITEPGTLLTVGSSPLLVNGELTGPDSVLTVNGAPVSPSAGRFSASVALQEGLNTIVARAVSGDIEVTDSIVVSLDATPGSLDCANDHVYACDQACYGSNNCGAISAATAKANCN